MKNEDCPEGPPTLHQYPSPCHARRSDPDTSQLAARMSQAKRSSTAQEVLRILRAAHAKGLTDDELQVSLPDIHRGTVSKTRLALVRAGLAEATAKRRGTRTGARAIVWRAVGSR